MKIVTENDITEYTEELWNAFTTGGTVKLKEKLSLQLYGAKQLIKKHEPTDLEAVQDLTQKVEHIVSSIKHNGISGLYDVLVAWYIK